MNNFQRGDTSGGVGWQLAGQGGPTTLSVKSHNVEISAVLADVTHTGSGGVRGRLAGVLDAAGSVEASLDLDQVPWQAPVFLLPGASGVMLFYLAPGKPLQIPVCVEKVRYQMAVESEIKYGADVKCNSRAGFIVYPAF